VHVQVFESSRPWHFDTALVKVAVAAADDDDDDDDGGVTCGRRLQCLALQRLHHNVRLAGNAPLGTLVTRVQLQPSPPSCQTDVRVYKHLRSVNINNSVGAFR